MSLLNTSGATVVFVLAILATTSSSEGQNAIATTGGNGNAFRFEVHPKLILWLTAKHVASEKSVAVGNVRGAIIAGKADVIHATFFAEGTNDDWSAWRSRKTDGDILTAGLGPPSKVRSVGGSRNVRPVNRTVSNLIAFWPPPVHGESGSALVDDRDGVVGIVIGATAEKNPIGLAVPIGLVIDDIRTRTVIPTANEGQSETFETHD